MDKARKVSFAEDLRQSFISGVLVLIPIGLTLFAMNFVLNLLNFLGEPVANAILGGARGTAPEWLAATVRSTQFLVNVLVAMALIYLLGWSVNRVVGRKLLQLFDAAMARIPLVKTIYGTMKQILATFQRRPGEDSKVVLINFPSPQVRSVGLLMRSFVDAASGRSLSSVYVPLAPNPTIGYLQVVPTEELIAIDWTVDQAMQFIVSGGAVSPERLSQRPGVSTPIAVTPGDLTAKLTKP